MTAESGDDAQRPWMTLAEVEATMPDGDYYLEERTVITTVGEKVTYSTEYRRAVTNGGPT